MTFNQMNTKEIIGVTPNTKLKRIERHNNQWLIWTATNDYRYGTYIILRDDGSVLQVTERDTEGPEIINVKPKDKE